LCQGPYIAGEKPTDSDYALIPKLHHLRIALGYYYDFQIPAKFTALHKYIDVSDMKLHNLQIQINFYHVIAQIFDGNVQNCFSNCYSKHTKKKKIELAVIFAIFHANAQIFSKVIVLIIQLQFFILLSFLGICHIVKIFVLCGLGRLLALNVLQM
jgi:hypothetical protein